MCNTPAKIQNICLKAVKLVWCTGKKLTDRWRVYNILVIQMYVPSLVTVISQMLEIWLFIIWNLWKPRLCIWLLLFLIRFKIMTRLWTMKVIHVKFYQLLWQSSKVIKRYGVDMILHVLLVFGGINISKSNFKTFVKI